MGQGVGAGGLAEGFGMLADRLADEPEELAAIAGAVLRVAQDRVLPRLDPQAVPVASGFYPVAVVGRIVRELDARGVDRIAVLGTRRADIRDSWLRASLHVAPLSPEP